MKKIIPAFFIFIFCFAAYGQNIIATTDDGEKVILKPNKTWEYAVKEKPAPIDITKNWDFIVEAKDDILGARYYFQSSKVKTDSIGRKETWLRIIPKNPAQFNKKNKIPLKTAYVQQFLSIDCESERYSTESAVFYDQKDDILGSNRFWNAVGFEKVIPNTISQGWKNALCK